MKKFEESKIYHFLKEYSPQQMVLSECFNYQFVIVITCKNSNVLSIYNSIDTISEEYNLIYKMQYMGNMIYVIDTEYDLINFKLSYNSDFGEYEDYIT